jgi:hypothetical protein
MLYEVAAGDVAVIFVWFGIRIPARGFIPARHP